MADASDAVKAVEELRNELTSIRREVQGTTVAFEKLRRWKERAVHQLRILVSPEEGERFQQKRMTSFSMRDPSGNFVREASLYDAHLESLRDELLKNPDFIMSKTDKQKEVEPTSWITRLNRLLARFHTVVRQMRTRHEQRATFEVQDEYDVQDILRALLKIDFDDIRTEEWTPSYAGGSSRMDFLLKEEQAVLEVKKTRASLKEKDIGAQLLVDIQRYQEHPDCKALICFIYDPEGLIGNPSGLINDLQKKSTAKLRVIVIINPM